MNCVDIFQKNAEHPHEELKKILGVEEGEGL